MRSEPIASKARLAVVTVLAVSGCTQPPPDFAGAWSTTLTVREDDAWRLEDFACFIGCSAPAYEHLRKLLNDPANDERPYELLAVEAWTVGAERFVEALTPEGRALRDEIGFVDDDVRACQRLGLVRQVLAPLPMKITQLNDRVVLEYEEWKVTRTVNLDTRDHPQTLQPSRYGHSVGRYEGSALVIETQGIAADRLFVDQGGGGHSDQARTVERYTRSADGKILRLDLTLEDPVTLREPLIYEKVWLSTPDVQFLEHTCETITGKP